MEARGLIEASTMSLQGEQHSQWWVALGQPDVARVVQTSAQMLAAPEKTGLLTHWRPRATEEAQLDDQRQAGAEESGLVEERVSYQRAQRWS